MSTHIAYPVATDRDGMARIGLSVNAMRGLRYADGEDGDAPGVEPEVSAPETPDYGLLYEGATARIGELELTVSDLTAQLQAVKAHNYELLVSSGSSTDVESAPENSANNSDDIDSDIEIDDLFGSDKDND